MKGDVGRISWVVEALVGNALIYTPSGGLVEVSLEQSGSSLKLKVKDNGVGISREDKPYIFAQFFRGEQAKSVDTEGSGVSLAIAKEIMKAHKGRIGFTSETGKGSTFWFQLPVVSKKVKIRIRSKVINFKRK